MSIEIHFCRVVGSAAWQYKKTNQIPPRFNKKKTKLDIYKESDNENAPEINEVNDSQNNVVDSAANILEKSPESHF